MRIFLMVMVSLSILFGADLSTRLDQLIHSKKENKIVVLNYNPFVVTKKVKGTTTSVMSTSNKQASPIHFVMVLNHSAFINGHWYKVGERVAGYKIKKIFTDKIKIEKKGVTRTLYLKKKQQILNIREK
ncbi:hypothetical protein [Sulfurospirillum sp. 1612]|uniref:hypothetical protein n=1 Tax=Sulfurospirillum sp. 1612 TaxID=3094835 RepID=UPI002F920C72